MRFSGRTGSSIRCEARDRCRARRFRLGEPNSDGRLVHRQGGFGGGTWLIDYDDRTTDDDEPGYRPGTHQFVEGEYVSITDDDTMRTFKLAHVRQS